MIGITTESTHVHLMQFSADRQFLDDAAAEFFAEAMTVDAPALMIARPSTFDRVVVRVAALRGIEPPSVRARVAFVEVHEVLGQFMDGTTVDPVRFEHRLPAMFARLLAGRADGQGWVYGEMADVLCTQGNHAAALQIEQIWSEKLSRDWPQVRVLCGYAGECFRGQATRGVFQAICRQHSHVMQDAPALLQGSTIYVVDDDPGVRSALGRLLAAAGCRVETFASAEEFLGEADRTATGCLIIDVQLPGLSGLGVQRLLAEQHWGIPVIVMSAWPDDRIGPDALRLGAQAFLRKPIDADALIDALIRALS